MDHFVFGAQDPHGRFKSLCDAYEKAQKSSVRTLMQRLKNITAKLGESGISVLSVIVKPKNTKLKRDTHTGRKLEHSAVVLNLHQTGIFREQFESFDDYKQFGVKDWQAFVSQFGIGEIYHNLDFDRLVKRNQRYHNEWIANSSKDTNQLSKLQALIEKQNAGDGLEPGIRAKLQQVEDIRTRGEFSSEDLDMNAIRMEVDNQRTSQQTQNINALSCALLVFLTDHTFRVMMEHIRSHSSDWERHSPLVTEHLNQLFNEILVQTKTMQPLQIVKYLKRLVMETGKFVVVNSKRIMRTRQEAFSDKPVKIYNALDIFAEGENEAEEFKDENETEMDKKLQALMDMFDESCKVSGVPYISSSNNKQQKQKQNSRSSSSPEKSIYLSNERLASVLGFMESVRTNVLTDDHQSAASSSSSSSSEETKAKEPKRLENGYHLPQQIVVTEEDESSSETLDSYQYQQLLEKKEKKRLEKKNKILKNNYLQSGLNESDAQAATLMMYASKIRCKKRKSYTHPASFWKTQKLVKSVKKASLKPLFLDSIAALTTEKHRKQQQQKEPTKLFSDYEREFFNNLHDNTATFERWDREWANLNIFASRILGKRQKQPQDRSVYAENAIHCFSLRGFRDALMDLAKGCMDKDIQVGARSYRSLHEEEYEERMRKIKKGEKVPRLDPAEIHRRQCVKFQTCLIQYGAAYKKIAARLEPRLMEVIRNIKDIAMHVLKEDVENKSNAVGTFFPLFASMSWKRIEWAVSVCQRFLQERFHKNSMSMHLLHKMQTVSESRLDELASKRSRWEMLIDKMHSFVSTDGNLSIKRMNDKKMKAGTFVEGFFLNQKEKDRLIATFTQEERDKYDVQYREHREILSKARRTQPEQVAVNKFIREVNEAMLKAKIDYDAEPRRLELLQLPKVTKEKKEEDPKKLIMSSTESTSSISSISSNSSSSSSDEEDDDDDESVVVSEDAPKATDVTSSAAATVGTSSAMFFTDDLSKDDDDDADDDNDETLDSNGGKLDLPVPEPVKKQQQQQQQPLKNNVQKKIIRRPHRPLPPTVGYKSSLDINNEEEVSSVTYSDEEEEAAVDISVHRRNVDGESSSSFDFEDGLFDLPESSEQQATKKLKQTEKKITNEK